MSAKREPETYFYAALRAKRENEGQPYLTPQQVEEMKAQLSGRAVRETEGRK